MVVTLPLFVLLRTFYHRQSPVAWSFQQHLACKVSEGIDSTTLLSKRNGSEMVRYECNLGIPTNERHQSRAKSPDPLRFVSKNKRAGGDVSPSTYPHVYDVVILEPINGQMIYGHSAVIAMAIRSLTPALPEGHRTPTLQGFRRWWRNCKFRRLGLGVSIFLLHRG